MRIKFCDSQRQAMNFVFPYMKKGRVVGVKKLKNGKWEARILARRQR